MNSKLKTVMVIDGGGRAAALVDKYLQSSAVGKVIAVPGNDLVDIDAKKIVKIFPQIKTTDILNIRQIAKSEKVDLVDVAQDDAVAAGVTDVLAKDGFRVFGPTKAAGQIEWDKAASRNFMQKFKIPIPQFKICQSKKEGIAYLKKQKESQWFIKAAGLAAGKGALFAGSNQEAINNIDKMKNFGKSGKVYLIEQCLVGEEFSSFAIVDGKKFILIGHAQDHKRVYDGDSGPNTGGMGCSSPPLVITKEVEKQIKLIFKKAVQGLFSIGRPYRGILYLGGMIVKEGGVYVIEFNARWGDPEAQVILPAIKNDWYQVASQVIDGKINQIKIKKDNLYRIVVTAASRGYPQDYHQVVGKQIFGIDKIQKQKGVKIFGAGVKKQGGKYFAFGGRIFYVMAQGVNVAQARKKAYNALSLAFVEGNNLHYRTDIGARDMERFWKWPSKDPRF